MIVPAIRGKKLKGRGLRK